QRQKAVVEQVGEGAQGGVAPVLHALDGVFGQVQRQRSVRAEQAQHVSVERGRMLAAGRRIGGDVAGRERQEGRLAQAHRVFGGLGRAAQARTVAVHALEQAQRREQLEAVRPRAQRGIVRDRRGRVRGENGRASGRERAVW